jgi:hypothetical protein
VRLVSGSAPFQAATSGRLGQRPQPSNRRTADFPIGDRGIGDVLLMATATDRISASRCTAQYLAVPSCGRTGVRCSDSGRRICTTFASSNHCVSRASSCPGPIAAGCLPADHWNDLQTQFSSITTEFPKSMQCAVRDALIGFMAASAQAQAPKLRQPSPPSAPLSRKLRFFEPLLRPFQSETLPNSIRRGRLKAGGTRDRAKRARRLIAPACALYNAG